MRRRTQQRWIYLSQWLSLLGLAAVVGWNTGHLLWPKLPLLPWWSPLLAPLPGLLAWSVGQFLPPALARTNKRAKSFRLTWHTGAGWDDARFRQALRNLIELSSGVDIVWAHDGAGLGCWLLADDDRVLRRMVSDVLPGGTLEEEPYPSPTSGVTVLNWPAAPPEPAALCQMAGVDGIYFRWLREDRAVTAMWGEQAGEAARRYARTADDLLAGEGESLLYPPFAGDNPWPALPPFPSSTLNAGLSSVSLLQRTAPALRVGDRGGLLLGKDAAGQPIGFELPDLTALRRLRICGHEAATLSLALAHQTVRAGLPVAFLDGSGTLTGLLSRRLARELAAGQVLTCDVERPAQSRQRLNPLWLPAGQPELWPALLGQLWPAWLRELGVTPAGLGQTAFRHARVAVMLTGLLAARRGLSLDPAALLETLEMPDFLGRAGEVGGPALFGQALWDWWQAEGRHTHNFDVHLRLGHLRERLNGLMALPEYGILWRPPFSDPVEIATRRLSLVWRLPDPRRRLRGYVSSQLLALASLLAAWPSSDTPLLIVLYELENVEPWAARLSRFPSARVVTAARQIGRRPLTGQLLLSRLERADAERVQAEGGLEDIRAADLRRLPDNRLILCRGKHLCTLDVSR